VGMSLTPDGQGYYLLGADGAVYAFGDAVFAGTIPQLLGGPSPDGNATAIAADPTGTGYLISTSLGAIYAFGNAAFYGSPLLSGFTPNAPIVDIAYAPDGTGYWVVGSDGGIFTFDATATVNKVSVTTGTADFYGSVPAEVSTAGLSAPSPIVGFAAIP
jgi:hypothetical protein